MDPRRASRTVIDPKVRQVGFITPGGDPTITSPSPLVSDISLSPVVIIPPPTHFSDNNNNFPIGLGLGLGGVESIPVGSSYNPSESIPASDSSGSLHKQDSKAVASSLPVGGGFQMLHKLKALPAPAIAIASSSLTTVSMLSIPPPNLSEKDGLSTGAQNESSASLKPSKNKSSKAERRAVQEAERAAKAAAKGA